jgi:DNA-binding transcriptional ArsR family regulator
VSNVHPARALELLDYMSRLGDTPLSGNQIARGMNKYPGAISGRLMALYRDGLVDITNPGARIGTALTYILTPAGTSYVKKAVVSERARSMLAQYGKENNGGPDKTPDQAS